jgi:hypothetical protein
MIFDILPGCNLVAQQSDHVRKKELAVSPGVWKTGLHFRHALEGPKEFSIKD